MTDTSPIALIREPEFYREVIARCRRFDVRPRGDEWIIMAWGWLHCCHRCDATAELHWDHAAEHLGPCPPLNCPGYRMRLLVKDRPTEREVLRYIDRVLDLEAVIP